jgi:predicted HicB family RNase H-like nuclease
MGEKEKITSKKFLMTMNSNFHQEVKIAAALRGISINLLIHRALYKYLRIEDRHQ